MSAVAVDGDPFFDLSVDLLCVAGTDGWFRRVNRAFTTVLGWTRDELITRPYMDIVHPDDHAATYAEFELLFAGRPTVDFENRLLAKDGTFRWVSWTSTPVPGDALIYSVARDVTERKEVEARSSRLARLLDQASDAIIAWEWGGAIVSWNEGASRLYGYASHQAIGRTSHDLLRTHHPDGVGEMLQSLAEHGSWAGEVTHTTRDGRTLTVESRHQIVAEDGRRLVLETNRDVTARKLVERERELFLRAVGHDLRNPLTVVRIQSQLLRRRLDRGQVDASVVAGAVVVLDEAVDGLTRRLDELADSTRQRAGETVEMARTGADLLAITRRVVAQHQGLTPQHQIRLDTALDDLNGPWDPTRLDRVVDNLVANAVKYSPAGGEVVVEVATVPREEPAWAVLRVRDTGIGIPQADLHRVFEQFRRGSNVDGIPGSGIGLSSVAQVVEGHGGVVQVESEEGRGSTFTVRLPLENA